MKKTSIGKSKKEIPLNPTTLNFVFLMSRKEIITLKKGLMELVNSKGVNSVIVNNGQLTAVFGLRKEEKEDHHAPPS